MCAVSMVTDYGKRWQPNVDDWQLPQIDMFKKLVEDAKEFDKKTGQPDCEAPDKKKFLADLDKRLEALEKKIDQLVADKTQTVVVKVVQEPRPAWADGVVNYSGGDVDPVTGRFIPH